MEAQESVSMKYINETQILYCKKAAQTYSFELTEMINGDLLH